MNIIQVLTDSDGYVLIDRNGKHFDIILDFLRQGTVSLPECRVEVAEILCEAKFYLIQVYFFINYKTCFKF